MKPGFATWVMALALMAGVWLAFQVAVDVADLATVQAQLDQAAAAALQSAATSGASVAAGTLTWNAAAAQQAAEQAVQATLAVRLATASAGQARFVPAAGRPAWWGGALRLAAFTTTAAPGPVTVGSQTAVSPGPAVGCALQQPVVVSFFGLPIRGTVTATQIDSVYLYNGQAFVTPAG